MIQWNRKQLLERLTGETFDILIIGGGSVGAGVAVDASTRGYKVALIEAEDFASKTSGKSTKLVHGGVRYLENAFKKLDYHEYTLVQEALVERMTLLSIAPHLTKKLPIVIPFYHWYEKIYYGLGVKVYEWMAGNKNIGRGKFLSAKEVKQNLPHIQSEGLKGGVLYYDGQFDDNRMNVSLALTALEKDAVVVNYAEFTEFYKIEGGIQGVEAVDKLSGESLSIKARVVVNAAGPFSDAIRKKDDPSIPPVIRGSSGTHLLLDQQFTPEGMGLLIPKTSDGRVLFLLPWQGSTLLGTTDDPCSIEQHPQPTDEDIDYLLEHINRYLDKKVTRGDVLAEWTGIRPLIEQSNIQATGKLSRDFHIEESPSGLYSIYGGKWTLYRKMAEEFMDTVIGKGYLEDKGPSKTASSPLVGAEGYCDELSQQLKGVDADVAEHLAQSYGDRAEKVIEYALSGFGNRLVEGYPYIEAEVVYAVKHELAQTAVDVLYRRLQIGLLNQEATNQAYPRVVEIMGDLLGRDDSLIEKKLSN
jgi:glycerol-3-phosphate dehydrogenase